MQCSNNMKQWTLSLHNYHDTHKAFPASHNPCHSTNTGSSGGSSYRRFSATYCLLPFMEETSRFEAIRTNVGDPWGTAGGYAKQQLSSVQCPSETNSRKPWGDDGAGGNLVVSLGDGAICNDDTSNGKMGQNGDVSSRGLFYPQYWKEMGSVTDGTSNTIAISESVVPTTSGSKEVKGGIAIVADIENGANSYYLRPSHCMGVKDGKVLTGTVRTSGERCTRYLDGLILYSGFVTIMPPNTPNCVRTDSEIIWGLFTAQSNHSGGVNTGLADGSVRFVSDSVDTNGLPDSQNGKALTGPSFYGVWSAMGTPSGGESKGL